MKWENREKDKGQNKQQIKYAERCSPFPLAMYDVKVKIISHLAVDGERVRYTASQI